MKSILYAVPFFLLVFIASMVSCQKPTETPEPSELKQIKELKEDLPTQTPIPLEEIVIDLPGLPEDATPLVLVRIPAGTFMMGRYASEKESFPDEDPRHQVTISKDFYMGKYEVTKAQWMAVMKTEPWLDYNGWANHTVLDDPDSPAQFIAWNDSQSFIKILNKLGKGTFRLPTEAEWEYACRAGMTTQFFWGDDPSYSQISDYAWWSGNAGYAHIVGQKLPNAWGLYDMSGNVDEYCQDCWHEGYTGAPSDGSAWESPTISTRVLRGGFWESDAWNCRSAIRQWTAPACNFIFEGFRIVREVD